MVHCFCICGSGALLEGLFGVSSSMECEVSLLPVSLKHVFSLNIMYSYHDNFDCICYIWFFMFSVFGSSGLIVSTCK